MAKEKASAPGILARAGAELIKVQTNARNMGVVEFIETIVDAFTVPLFLSQRVLLKSIYGEELDSVTPRSLCGPTEGACKNKGCSADHRLLMTEQQLMDQWVKTEKTNWRHPRAILSQKNMARSLEGKDLLKRFDYQAITVQAGMRSSKSASMALLGAYEFFKAITHDCIQAEMGLPKSSPLYITAVASTERQALGTIFYYIKEYITKSTFFKTFIDSGEIQVRELDISFPSKNIIIASGHSQATGFVGRTALMVLFDELAMFSADESNTSNAADVYQRIGRSTATAKHLGKIIALSSVKCEGDFMETLVEGDWERQEHGALVFDLSTFDVNPLLDLDEPSIKQAYDKDLVSAQRDFENIRPGAVNQFLIPEVIAKACEGRDPQEHCKYASMPIFRKRGEALEASGSILIDEETEDELREMAGLQIAVEPVTSHLIQSYAHCDPGVKHDSFGFACGHPEYIEGLGVATVIDICLEWMPRALGKNKFALVDLVNVEEVLIEIAKARRACQVTFDHWNASASVQRLWREGIVARELHFGAGLQKRMFENFRARLNQGLIRIPNHPTLIEELECLELRGERVDHPKGKESKIPGRARVSKDLADAVVAVDYAISQLEREFVRTQSYGGAVPGRGHANIKLVGQTRASRSSGAKWNSR